MSTTRRRGSGRLAALKSGYSNASYEDLNEVQCLTPRPPRAADIPTVPYVIKWRGRGVDALDGLPEAIVLQVLPSSFN